MFVFNSCTQESKSLPGQGADAPNLFVEIPSSQSKVLFQNRITETEKFNYLHFDGIYEGAGVGIIDINNDGLEDVFFASSMESDRLYLNKGDFKFEDITLKAGVSGGKGWSTGVSIADVNGDGLLDIYVSKFLLENENLRRNLLFINNGDLTFTESASKYGIDDTGYSKHANFFDFNNDGWLDLYVGNQPPNNRMVRQRTRGQINYKYTDKLYKNNGGESFTDVTQTSGIKNFSHTHSAIARDFDKDGWIDLYVTSDFTAPDFLYHNNQDGTFTNIADSVLRHMSNFSMGVDVEDFNNDGWMDIFVLDMVAEDNYRLKTNMSGMNPTKFWNLALNGFHYQYMFNNLQLNNGNGTFSEIGQLAGVAKSDWSWSPLFADLDNDGLKDLYVTNGLLLDIRNNDYNKKADKLIKKRNAYLKAKDEGTLKPGQEDPNIQMLDILAMAPSVKVPNQSYKNNGDLSFQRVKEEWGIDKATWSNGSAYADLDNDGDLDLVINNINDEALIFKNTCVEKKTNNYFNVEVRGTQPNLFSIGAKVEITVNGKKQYTEVSSIKGYLSASQTIVHFGVGNATNIEKLKINWLDGTEFIQENIAVNQTLIVNQEKSSKAQEDINVQAKMFVEVAQQIGLDLNCPESDYDDYLEEILLPHKMSTLGPCLGLGDVNGDGREDVFIGGSAGKSGQLLLQNGEGKFEASASAPWSKDKGSEDTGCLFFDADGDKDLDLYVSSGSNEFKANSGLYQDRLYLNNGKGDFKKSTNSLPKFHTSTSKVKAADFDKDGDLDLFVGGRQLARKYGFPVSSYLLINNNGKFSDQTKNLAPELIDLGMVTDAAWLDMDEDQDLDLVMVGEWMPITVFRNNDGSFENATNEFGFQNTNGWWNCIETADLDNDNDLDLLVGNLGLNIKYKASVEEPFKCYVKDFDENGTNDVYLGYYDLDGVCYPVRGRQCSSEQMPFIKEKFINYDAFGKADIETVLEGKMEGAVELNVNIFESVLVTNNGSGGFEVKNLPLEAQVAPTFGFVVHDWNNDGRNDILLAGNYYNREVETTRSDAGIGCVLLQSEEGAFIAEHPAKTGVKAYKDVRDVKMINTSSGKPIVLIANNDDKVQAYQFEGTN